VVIVRLLGPDGAAAEGVAPWPNWHADGHLRFDDLTRIPSEARTARLEWPCVRQVIRGGMRILANLGGSSIHSTS